MESWKTNSRSSLDSPTTLSGMCVCLVEDDVSAGKVYRKWMEEAGAKTIHLTSYEEFCTHACATEPFSDNEVMPRALVTDLVLPDGSGIQVLTQWRKVFPSLPALIFTGFATIENAVDSMKLGAFDFLRKPIEREEFILAMRRALDFVNLLDENDSLAGSVRILAMAQTLAQISDQLSLLKTFGRILHRETKSDECFVFFYETKRSLPECLLECHRPGLPRVGAESVFASLVLRFVDKSAHLVDDDIPSLDNVPDPIVRPIPDKHALIVELRSQTGNSAYIVLFARHSKRDLTARLHDLSPVVTQAARGFHTTDVTTTLSFVDDLTGLYNSRFLKVALENEVIRASRYGFHVSVLFIDLDKFKLVNDTHGHIVGSRILKESSEIFRQCTRESDLLLRFGGDEFLFILPNTDLEGATAVAERVRSSFNGILFDVRAVTGIDTAKDLNVTTSIGVACFPTTANTYQELIQQADAAMYRSKALGKNCITVAQSEAEQPKEAV